MVREVAMARLPAPNNYGDVRTCNMASAKLRSCRLTALLLEIFGKCIFDQF